MKDNQELVVLPEIDYKITTESAQVVAKEYIEVPEFDPALGVKDETNAMIIKGSKFLNKEVALVEKLRKSFKEPALTFGRAVDNKAKELKAILEPAKLRYAEARYTIDRYAQEQEQKKIDAEKLRVEALDLKIRELQDIPKNAIGKTSKEIKSVYDTFEYPTEEEYQEKLEIAIFLYSENIGTLDQMADQAEKAEQAEAMIAEAKAKAEKEAAQVAEAQKAERVALDKEREEFNREKRAAKEVEDMKKAEAEAEALATQQQNERDEREAAAVEAKTKEDKYYIECEEETLKAMMDIYEKLDIGDTPESYLKDILCAIIEGDVPHVSWTV